MLGSFAITVAAIALLSLGFAYPTVGAVMLAVMGFCALWGLMDSLFGHHFRVTDDRRTPTEVD
jgi:hypothetical protein